MINVTVVVLLLALSGCASVPRATQGGRLLDIWSQVSTKESLRVRGICTATDWAKGRTSRRATSRNAALVAARYELLGVIKGVKLEGGVTMAQLMEKDSLIREIANEVVSGGDEVLTEWLPDDGCVVTLELKRSKVERLIHEKSQREKGLEKRVAKDIAEINRLNAEIIKIGQNKMKVFWQIDDVNELDQLMKVTSKAAAEAKTSTEMIMAGHSMLNLLQQMQEQEDAGLR